MHARLVVASVHDEVLWTYLSIGTGFASETSFQIMVNELCVCPYEVHTGIDYAHRPIYANIVGTSANLSTP